MGPRFALPDRSSQSADVCDSAVTSGGRQSAAERTEGLGKVTGACACWQSSTRREPALAQIYGGFIDQYRATAAAGDVGYELRRRSARICGREAERRAVGAMIRRRAAGALTTSPLMRRIAFHFRRMTPDVDAGFFIRLFIGLLGFVLLACDRGDVHRATEEGRRHVLLATGIELLLGPDHGDGRRQLVLRRDAGRLRHLVGDGAFRGRDRGDDHRRARRLRHRFSAQGGPGHGRIRLSRAHRRLRLESDRARPDRRTQPPTTTRRRSSSFTPPRRTRAAAASITCRAM